MQALENITAGTEQGWTEGREGLLSFIFLVNPKIFIIVRSRCNDERNLAYKRKCKAELCALMLRFRKRTRVENCTFGTLDIVKLCVINQ